MQGGYEFPSSKSGFDSPGRSAEPSPAMPGVSVSRPKMPSWKPPFSIRSPEKRGFLRIKSLISPIATPHSKSIPSGSSLMRYCEAISYRPTRPTREPSGRANNPPVSPADHFFVIPPGTVRVGSSIWPDSNDTESAEHRYLRSTRIFS